MALWLRCSTWEQLECWTKIALQSIGTTSSPAIAIWILVFHELHRPVKFVVQTESPHR